MEVPGPHVRANQLSAISNNGQVRFMTYTQTMNAALFLVFLQRLLRSTTGKLFLIVDRVRAHMTPAVQAWVAARRDRLEVFYLPRYAPELNPDAYLNDDLKEQVKGLRFSQVETIPYSQFVDKINAHQVASGTFRKDRFDGKLHAAGTDTEGQEFTVVLPDPQQSKADLIKLLTEKGVTFDIAQPPISEAVFKLIQSSKVVGCSTGRSAGLAPFRILST